MRYMVYLLLMVVLFSGCMAVRECSSPGDCEGKEHPGCYGDWLCRDSECSWMCMGGVIEVNKSVSHGNITEPECINNSGCVIGGFNGQLCGTLREVSGLVTNREWGCRYGCLKKTTCDCINGSCGWRINNEYLVCMKGCDGDKSRFFCEHDSDCALAQCCHPTYCVNTGSRPDCSNVNCSEGCESVLDCGGGRCVCFGNECVVKKTT